MKRIFRSRSLIQKKYVAFFTVIPLLIVTAFVQVECPVCEGTGNMTNSLGMENVQITGMESKEIGTIYHACGLFLIYGYEIKITLKNKGTQDAIGWLKMVLVDFTQGTPQDNQYAVVEIPKASSKEYMFMCWFNSNHNQKQITEVRAAVLTGEVPDETCAGTGKVALNQSPFLSRLKERIEKLYVADVPWAPPAAWEWANDEDTGASAFIGFYDPFAN